MVISLWIVDIARTDEWVGTTHTQKTYGDVKKAWAAFKASRRADKKGKVTKIFHSFKYEGETGNKSTDDLLSYLLQGVEPWDGVSDYVRTDSLSTSTLEDEEDLLY